VSDGFQALGMLLAGLLAGPLGLLPVLNGQAGLYLLAGLLAFALLARRAGGRPGPPSPEPAAAAVPGALRATEPARQTA